MNGKFTYVPDSPTLCYTLHYIMVHMDRHVLVNGTFYLSRHLTVT